MASKETDQLIEDELQALHQSIEQLNSGNSEVSFQNDSLENQKTSKRKRANQADVQTQTPKKSKRRNVNIPEECLSDPNNPIDEILEGIALRKNLTTNNVKHLLRNIIANESVQEMLKCSLDSNLKMSFQPKLTRSKTKEWLENQNNLAWPSSAKKASDTQILMEEDFPEDSSDEDVEYRPNEDDTDNHSDEGSFLSSHTSDIGSPSSSVAASTPKVSQSIDPFKRPFPIEEPQIQEDLIGSRTRSKLPLNDTPLEHLELAFIPPDISTDMYDSDCDNEEWRTFLKEFVCPPSNHLSENLDDEEADPEYNVLEEEEEEVDAEELRADRTVQITKKEVSELLSELFEEDFSSSDEETTKPSNNLPRVQQPTEDILQTAISDIIVQLEPSSPEISKTLGKPTGIVQPLVLNHEAQMPFTISFPTMDLPPIEMFHNPCSSSSEVSSLQSYTVELSPEATLLLNEQLRKHVQLLTQMHLITAQQAGLENVTEECRFMLQDLVPLKQRVDIANLDEAIDLVNHWETVVTKVPPEELTKFQRTIVVCGEKKKFFKRSSKHPERYPFNPKMVELMAESRVFIYPELLPKLAIFQSEPGPCKMSSYEEQLIAMGMEQFTPFCKELLIGKKSSVENMVNSMISHYMLPHWTAKQIGIRIKNKSFKNKRSKEEGNPIKYYLANKVAPPIHHNSIQPFDCYSTTALCDVPPNLLPERWREIMLIHGGMRCRSRKNSMGHPPTKTKKKKSDSNNSKTDEQIAQASQRIPQSVYSPVLCDLVETDNNNSCTNIDLNNLQPTEVFEDSQNNEYQNQKENQAPEGTHSSNDIMIPVVDQETDRANPEENNASSETDPTPMKVTSISERVDLAEKDSTSEGKASAEENMNNENLTKSPEPTDVSSVCSNQLDVIDTDFECESELPLGASSPHDERNRTCQTSNQGAKRYVLIHRPDSNMTHVMHVWGPSSIAEQTTIPIRTAADREANNPSGETNPSSQGNQKSSSSGAEGGSGIFCPSGSGASGTSAGNSGGDDGDKPPSSPLSSNHVDENLVMEDDDEEEDSISLDFLTTVPLATNSVPKGRSPAHRHIRHQRNAKRILDSWMADDDPVQPRSDAYAQIYFMKVRSRLEQSNPVAFKEFFTTLGQFQSSSGSFLELYRKIETILKDNMDLLEEFVLFLSPEAAAQCGVQFQHFLYVRMREFFSKLKIHFKDSPSQLKRTLKTLQQVESSASPNINEIKNAILPLLKGNAHLTQGFLQLFPDDAPPPSDSGDFEDVNMDQINSGDEFEHVHISENTQAKENEVKSGKRTGMKGSAKNKNKGKSWKKS
ncbi:uncharacterized protein LOC124311787 isoform X2 [Daphnia pulicaria]|uniref:uncharacterized protein LOC124311787 isoform X2 n=1 Tax=Daphnia pulicaria TaxID=35523 RepID=UPI001EEC001A|nr:uncharacterized protein LOC124311787 isoform X2 [Daphnia pulicaria]